MRKCAFKGGPKTEKCRLLQKSLLAYAYSFIALGTISVHFIYTYLCRHEYMTYSGIVQKYKEGIGAFDWPEGVGPWGAKRHKICATCTILFEIVAPMLHHVGHL